MLCFLSIILAFVPLSSPPVSVTLEAGASGGWQLEVIPHQGWRLNQEVEPRLALVVKVEGLREVTGAEAIGWPARPRVAIGRSSEVPRGEVMLMLCREDRCRRVIQAIPAPKESR